MSAYNKIKVEILKFGSSNIFSIFQACKEIGFNTKIVTNGENKFKGNILILPGVGSFPEASKLLKKKSLDKKIIEFTQNKNNYLFGICLGMQLLFNESNEFKKTKGLGLIKGKVKSLKYKNKIIRNIGWKKISINSYDKLFSSFNNKYFYFVHSFACHPDNKKNNLFISNIKNKSFCTMTRHNNIIGTQFHPEKSGKDGLNLLKNLKKLL